MKTNTAFVIFITLVTVGVFGFNISYNRGIVAGLDLAEQEINKTSTCKYKRKIEPLEG